MTAVNRLPVLAKYVRSIRNPAKRLYADQYVTWRLFPTTIRCDPDNGPDWGCSYMAAQEVRMHVDAVLG